MVSQNENIMNNTAKQQQALQQRIKGIECQAVAKKFDYNFLKGNLNREERQQQILII